MNIREIADKLITLSQKEGADQAETYVVLAKTSSVYIDDNIPKIADVKMELGINVKFITGKKIGFTSSTLLNETPEEVVIRAKKLASLSEEDTKFVSLPEPQQVSGNRERFYDKKTANVSSDEILEKAMLVVDSTISNGITVPNGVLRASSVDYQVKNTQGIDTGSMGTQVFGYFTAKSDKDGAVGEGVQRCWSRELGNIDFAKMGTKLQAQALAVLNAEPFKAKWEDITAVLAPSEGCEMLGNLVGSACSAENVNNRSSPWTDRVGDKVAHESLTVYDNGQSENGLLSGIVDAEGFPTQKTLLIDHGVLQSYYYDSYNGNQVGLESTGNGIRRDSRDAHGSFNNLPSCASSTLEVSAGKYSVEELIGQIKKGVYIEHFAWPQVDAISGSFSNEIRNARLIENGELTTQIKYALLVGNLYESIQKEILYAKDLQVNSKRFMPTIAFSGIELVGQE